MNFKPHIIEAYGPQQVPEIAKFVESNLYETGKDRPSHGVTKTAKVSTVQWNTCRHFLDWSQQLAKFWNSKEMEKTCEILRIAWNFYRAHGI
jgi:hypothetical protein